MSLASAGAAVGTISLVAGVVGSFSGGAALDALVSRGVQGAPPFADRSHTSGRCPCGLSHFCGSGVSCNLAPFFIPSLHPADLAQLPGTRHSRSGDHELLGRVTLEYKPEVAREIWTASRVR
jgi:hypothetical protein